MVVDHETALNEVEKRGFETSAITDYSVADEDFAEFESELPHVTLDWYEVEGQVTDGLFEDPFNGPEFNFTNFFTEAQHIVGRMMYYMIRVYGTDFTYEDLVDTIAVLAQETYNVPFDQDVAFSHEPKQ